MPKSQQINKKVRTVRSAVSKRRA